MPMEQIEEVMKATGTVDDDEGMIKYDGKLIISYYLTILS